MLLVMADDGDAHTAGDFAVEEMIGKALQVDPPAIWPLEVKALWLGSGQAEERVQLLPEFVAEPVVDGVVVAQNAGDIPQDAGFGDAGLGNPAYNV